MSGEYNPDFWKKPKGSGDFNGMCEDEWNRRTVEQRFIEHPDGRKETVHTVTDVNWRVAKVAAESPEAFKVGAAAFLKLRKPINDQTTPMFTVSNLRSRIMEEIEAKLAGNPEASPKAGKQYQIKSGD